MPFVGDLLTCNGIMVKGKQVFNSAGELTVSATIVDTSTVSGNSTVCGTILTDNLSEKTAQNGITVTGNLLVSGEVCLFSSGRIKIGVYPVVSARQADIAKANGTIVGNVSATANLIIDALRAHGLIGPLL